MNRSQYGQSLPSRLVPVRKDVVASGLYQSTPYHLSVGYIVLLCQSAESLRLILCELNLGAYHSDHLDMLTLSLSC